MEEKIADYLKSEYSEYNPQAMLLVGSRASGHQSKGSDWDLYVLGPDKHRGIFFEWNGELLDVSFKELPAEDGTLTNPYKPLWPVKILLDSTAGVLNKVLQNTKAEYDKGPLIAYAEGCEDRLRKLQRGVHKIRKYENDRQVQFHYLTYNYHFLIRSWFEQHNLWPLPPREALPYIQEHDEDFWDLLNNIMDSRGKELSNYVEQAVKKIELIT